MHFDFIDVIRVVTLLAALGLVAWLIANLDNTGRPATWADRARLLLGNLDAQHGEVALRSSSDVRTDLGEAAQRLAELRSTPADKRGDTFDDDLRAARVDVLNLDVEFDAVRKAEEYDVRRGAWDEALANPERPEARGPEAAFLRGLAGDRRTAGQAYTESEDYRSWAARGVAGAGFYEAPIGNHELRALLDSTSDGSGSDAGVFLPVGQPIPPNARRQRLFIRDVVAVQPTGLSNVPYIRELNPATNETGATAVAEGSAKPEVTMEFEQDDAPIRKIAAWIPVTTEIVEDAPTLRGYIDTRLAYMLALREEAQVLNGPGTGPNIKGIRQFSGVQTQSVVAGDYPATIGRSIGKIENVDGFPNFVASNPLDFWVAVTTRHANDFDGEGTGAPNGAPSGIPNITWGLTPIRSRSMESGKSLVGDGAMGATIFDRQDTVIRVGNQHAEYMTENKVLVLAERREGVAVHRPDFFVVADVPTS